MNVSQVITIFIEYQEMNSGKKYGQELLFIFKQV